MRVLGLAAVVVLGAVVIAAPDPAGSEESTAEQVIASHLEARGGAERWRQVDALEMKGIYSAISKRSQFTLIRKRGDLYRLDYRMADAPAIRAHDRRGPWMLNAWLQPEAARVTEDPYKRQLEREARFPLLLLDYDEKGIALKYLGAGDLDGVPTVNLEVTLADGQQEVWYFDAETFLEVAIDSQVYDYTQGAEPIRQRVFFDDFREVEGVILPFQVDWEFGARLESMMVEEVVINPELDESRLSPPSEAASGKEQS